MKLEKPSRRTAPKTTLHQHPWLLGRRLWDEGELLEDDRTQPAIIVWDEVDKIRTIENQHPVTSRGVQQDLLSYLDGTLCGKSGNLDSTRFLNVACGAFVGLDQFRKPRHTTSQIGLLATASNASPPGSLESLCPQHLFDYGLIPEFVGRFSTVTELNPLDAGTLKRVLTRAEDSAMVRTRRLFEIHGIALIVTDDALDEMIIRAVNSTLSPSPISYLLSIDRRESNHFPTMIGSVIWQ